MIKHIEIVKYLILLYCAFGVSLNTVHCQVITPILNPEGGQGYSCGYNNSVYNCDGYTVTPWSSWGTCSSCNGIISRQRSASGTVPQGGPGLSENVKCLDNQSCEACSYTSWSSWSACSDSCETGTKYRTRSISSNNDCSASEDEIKLFELANCGNNPCNCDETIRGPNGLYYRGCQKYSRSGMKCLNWTSLKIDAFDYLATLENSGISNHSFCRNPISNNTLIPTIWCYVSMSPLTPQLCDPIPTDCVVTEWGAWSSCSSTCEEGKVTRTRTIVQESLHGGAECPEDLEQVQDCSVDVICPVDCVLGSWSYWSSCSVDCGKGNSTRSRSIITRPKGKGAVCQEYSQTKSCDGESCLSFWEKNKYSIISFAVLGLVLISSIIYILIPNNRAL
ncbi:TSP1 domain-containing protein TSP10 precursor [Cryptosporidium ubiquitum]|uniref:TSP1 domain-containing protein TSP10 n=1 Tax=Cryptosporidium ubiquitum TaxID=857276 RepID=A0A1J4MD25_9CRYT|nr:TSP1 domain-containing protein TSP10 precursor [Cryptosporidium ubiquitum]OII71879.1 TSP1 domain-containing protein TSP10 precursor [Cryptosporidium ubiquitum]